MGVVEEAVDAHGAAAVVECLVVAQDGHGVELEGGVGDGLAGLEMVHDLGPLVARALALEEGREFHSCSDSNVHLWLVDVSLPEYPQLTVNDVYIELKTKNNTIVTNDATHPLNVQTTMKEVFY